MSIILRNETQNSRYQQTTLSLTTLYPSYNIAIIIYPEYSIRYIYVVFIVVNFTEYEPLASIKSTTSLIEIEELPQETRIYIGEKPFF